MILVSVIGIGIVALAIYVEPPETSINCDDQICTTGTIAQVVDGDTVKFLSDDGEEIRIRLALVNAAERLQNLVAKKQKYLQNHNVQLEVNLFSS